MQRLSTARSLVDALRRRQVSALELTDEAIARIEALDPRINAVVVRDFERARATAKAADIALAQGETAPLLGIPMTVKESHHVAGLPTTWGIEAYRGWISDSDGDAIKRLKAAGAVILGKTNVPTQLADWQTINPIYGRTNNPWDLTRTPGGSSGGSAAALAAGMVSLELGSDFAGSLRVPAGFCGVCAHKPTYGLISTRGFGPPGIDLKQERPPHPMAVIGPMARSTADLMLMLDVLAPAPPDVTPVRRALLIDAHPNVPIDSEVLTALHETAQDLERRGVTVDRTLHTDLLDASLDCFRQTLIAALSAAVIDMHSALHARWSALFQSYDVVLTPTYGTAAFVHDANPDMMARTLLVDGKETPYVLQSAWSSMASVAGIPATAVPIGQTKSGLPIGIQVMGARGRDRLTLAFAETIEKPLSVRF